MTAIHWPRFRRSLFQRLLSAIFRIVNRYAPWHRLPRPLALLNLLALRNELRERNLYDTGSAGTLTGDAAACDPAYLVARSADGRYNDLDRVEMGMAGARFGRNVPAEQTWPPTNEALVAPSPRTISNQLLARRAFVPATTLNVLAAAWIQFQVHDWFSHGGTPAPDRIRVPLDSNDDWFEPAMLIPRSARDPTRSPGSEGPPTYINDVSHWWDASAIYGCDAAACRRLRTLEEGKLVVRDGRLPLDPETGISITGFSRNWWLGLALLHTLFTLEHNAICDQLRADHPDWRDERLYQTARLINAALIAKIHTLEWTPAIAAHPAVRLAMSANWHGLASGWLRRLARAFGDAEVLAGIPGSATNHHGVPFSLTEEFVSVYRLHPLIPDEYTICSATTGQRLKSVSFDALALGHASSVLQDGVTPQDALYSFGIACPGAIRLHNYPHALRDLTTPDHGRIDLAAVDIVRDRERGVPRYNRFRELLHLPRVQTFHEVTSNREWARELSEVYADVDQIDLMVGLYAEDLPAGFGFSDTAFRVFILMASRRLKSDRFFTSSYTPEVYTPTGLRWIDENDFVTVLLRHYPELARPLDGVSNAFAPWRALDRHRAEP